MLKARQMIMCQVTKNPIGAKGARLTQEVSLPGRFVVLIPNSKTYGISKRLPDDTRKRLRNGPRSRQARRSTASSCGRPPRTPLSTTSAPT
jgi:Rne/Rng family ribonuclease